MAIEQVTEPVILNSTGQQMLTALETIAQKVDVAKSSTLRDVPFGVGTGDWTASGVNYVATVSSTYVTATSREWVTFDDTFRSYANGDISVDKVHGGGGITLTTSAVPSGTIQGVLYIIDTDDGKVPVLIEGTVTPIENGGTGQSTVSGAQNALGISALSDRVDSLNSNLNTFNMTTNGLVFSSNVTYRAGGYCKVGNIVFVQLRLVTNADITGTGTAQLVTGFPHALSYVDTALSDETLAIGVWPIYTNADPSLKIRPYVSGLGYLYLSGNREPIPANTIIGIAGVYLAH